MSQARLRIDYVSPLPPVRSGIADYSLDLLPFLAERADVRVIRLPGQPVEDRVAAEWSPIDADTWLAESDSAHLPLYQMGNNPWHRGVELLAMLRPGALTLHDLVLHHYLLGRTVGEDDYPPYERRLAGDHGWIGERVARPFAWDAFGNASQFSLPAHRRLLRRQRGVLVHSDWARQMIVEENPDLDVHVARMGIPPVAATGVEAGDFRRRRGIPDDVFLLGSFGFQTPMKRPLEVMRAMTRPEMEGVHLLIAGELAPALDLKRRIHQLDLGSRIHVTGFLPYDEFESAIAASDLALNLRYPSAGETSASLLRVLAVGKAALISDYAQFAELPEDIGIKIPVGEGEVEALVRAVVALQADRPRLAAMEERARRFVAREHRLEDAAEDIVAAGLAIAENHFPSPIDLDVSPPTSIAWHRLPGEIRVEGIEPSWPEGEWRDLRVTLTNGGDAVWLPLAAGEGGVGVRLAITDGRIAPCAAATVVLPLGGRLAPGRSATLSTRLRRPVGGNRLQAELVLPAADPQPLERPRWVGSLE